MKKSQLISLWVVVILWTITIFFWYTGDSYSWGFTQFVQATIFWGIFGFLLFMTFGQRKNQSTVDNKISPQKTKNNFITKETVDLNLNKNSVNPPENINFKDLNKFSGWLRWFYFMAWIGFIAMAGFEVYCLFMNTNVFFKVLLLIAYAISMFFLYKIIIITRKKDETVPDNIVQLMSWGLLLNVIFSILEIFTFIALAGFNESSEMLTEFCTNLVRSVISYLIWTSYFQRSKRVCVYYGKNAGKALLKMDTIRNLFRRETGTG